MSNIKLQVAKLVDSTKAAQTAYQVPVKSVEELDGYIGLALFHPRNYSKIFDKKAKDSTKAKRRLSVVKITFPNGKSIYRKFKASSHQGVTADIVALHPNSIYEAYPGQQNDPIYVEISPANCWGKMMFNWNHPDNAVRSSYRLAVIGAVTGILGIITSIVL